MLGEGRTRSVMPNGSSAAVSVGPSDCHLVGWLAQTKPAAAAMPRVLGPQEARR